MISRGVSRCSPVGVGFIEGQMISPVDPPDFARDVITNGNLRQSVDQIQPRLPRVTRVVFTQRCQALSLVLYGAYLPMHQRDTYESPSQPP